MCIRDSYDTMQYIKPDVSTICIGMAASMGAFLLSSGAKGKRFALPNAEIMIHQPLGGAQGQAEDIRIHAEWIIKTREKLNRILCDNTGQKMSKIEKDTDRDNFMGAEEALSLIHIFIESELCENNTLFVSFRKGRHGDKGFLDDYAFYTYGLLSLYDVTLDSNFLNRAKEIGCKAIDDFYDMKNGGFYLYGKENETLIFRPKEKYDGAMPSGNSMMAYNLVRMNYLNSSEKTEGILETQLKFMCGEAEKYPTGYGMFLVALSDYFYPPLMITVVLRCV